jgi:hypothetical protein
VRVNRGGGSLRSGGKSSVELTDSTGRRKEQPRGADPTGKGKSGGERERDKRSPEDDQFWFTRWVRPLAEKNLPFQ